MPLRERQYALQIGDHVNDGGRHAVIVRLGPCYLGLSYILQYDDGSTETADVEEPEPLNNQSST